jgi:hypothetical protein
MNVDEFELEFYGTDERPKWNRFLNILKTAADQDWQKRPTAAAFYNQLLP